MRILMVCLGNICRSPIAEGILKAKAKKAGLDWVIESAGTESYHIGEAPHKFSQRICTTMGIDISEQKARQFKAADLDRFDKIYAMAHDVYEEIRTIAGYGADMSRVEYFLNELDAGQNGSVPDPWSGPEEGYIRVYDLIDRTCDKIIAKYKEL